jgi:hypothetical protein
VIILLEGEPNVKALVPGMVDEHISTGNSIQDVKKVQEDRGEPSVYDWPRCMEKDIESHTVSWGPTGPRHWRGLIQIDQELSLYRHASYA